MSRWLMLVGLSALLILPACQQPREQAEVRAKDTSTVAAEQQRQQQAGQTREQAEFMGQAPKVEDAPETVVLQAKNGNVTLTHRAHAGMTDCKTCHGEAKPGKIEGFDKEKAHALCQGCHKEKGAGPTKCNECHKKS